MKQSLAWLSGFVGLTLVVACGETSNLVGEEPTSGSSGAGGSGTAGKSSGGSTPGGTKSTGGSSSTAGTAGKAPTAGTRDPGACVEGDGNWVVCDSGLVHRTDPAMCKNTLPRAEALPATTGGMDECLQDTDCTEKPHGYCSLVQGGGFVPIEPYNACSYGCTVDAECGQGQACRCGDGIGTCVSSGGCLSDRDCGGTLCSQYGTCPGAPFTSFGCETAADECQTDRDCTDPDRHFCSVEGDHRVCLEIRCFADIAPAP